jgi:hypothetical protein
MLVPPTCSDDFYFFMMSFGDTEMSGRMISSVESNIRTTFQVFAQTAFRSSPAFFIHASCRVVKSNAFFADCDEDGSVAAIRSQLARMTGSTPPCQKSTPDPRPSFDVAPGAQTHNRTRDGGMAYSKSSSQSVTTRCS